MRAELQQLWNKAAEIRLKPVNEIRLSHPHYSRYKLRHVVRDLALLKQIMEKQ